MSSSDRPKRPIPERTAPIRDWRGLFDGAAPDRQPDPTSSAGGASSDPASRLTGAVARSVEIGYRVIDDHLQQGQRAARRLSSGRPAPEVWVTEVQDLGIRMARYASDFMATWMELLELTARGNPPPDPRAQPTPDGADGRQATAPAPGDSEQLAAATSDRADRVRIAVRSARPIEVEVDYHADRVTGPNVRVHALRSLDPDAPRIDTIAFRPGSDGGQPTLDVRVDDAPPPGRYEGLLIDEHSNRPVGSVRIVIRDDDASAS